MLSPSDVNSSEIEGWGSGFFLKYKGILYFVTCDHNVHLLDDFENGERCGEDYNIAVIANVKGKDEPLSSGFLTLPSFVYYDKYDIDLPEAKDLIDVAFTEVKEPIHIPLLTNMLCDIDGNILVNHGEEKLILSDAAIDHARADDELCGFRPGDGKTLPQISEGPLQESRGVVVRPPQSTQAQLGLYQLAPD